MTIEERQLLLKDLCARLPYKPMIRMKGINCVLRNIVWNDFKFVVNQSSFGTGHGDKGTELFNSITGLCNIKPYLRPLSSMTEEEYEEYLSLNEPTHLESGMEVPCIAHIEWLNKKFFDYRIVPSTGKTMIESELALEAPEGMYKNS